MKKILLSTALFLLGITAYCQEETNGTIYIKHPYIDVVNTASKAYENQDVATLKKLYADTARYWSSGMEKFVPIADAMKMWMSHFENYEDIKQVTNGYPDYLHYNKDNSMVVQSWWTWTGKSKSTGKVMKVPMVIFDDFNSDGKIIREYVYGDFSNL